MKHLKWDRVLGNTDPEFGVVIEFSQGLWCVIVNNHNYPVHLSGPVVPVKLAVCAMHYGQQSINNCIGLLSLYDLIQPCFGHKFDGFLTIAFFLDTSFMFACLSIRFVEGYHRFKSH